MKKRLAFAFLLVSCSSAPVSSEIVPEPPAQPPRVVFEGNMEVPSSDLLAVMTVAQRPPTRELLVRDVLWLTATYFDRGYLRVKIDPPEVSPAEIRIRISEGSRYRIGKLTIAERGNELAPLAGLGNLRDRVHLADGATFSRAPLVRDIDDIRTHYRDAGYASADISPTTKMDDANKTVDIDIPIVRGPLTYVDHVGIVGNARIDAATIRKHVILEDGALFNETKLADAKKTLLALGAFERVDIVTEEKPSHTRWTVTVEVKENDR